LSNNNPENESSNYIVAVADTQGISMPGSVPHGVLLGPSRPAFNGLRLVTHDEETSEDRCLAACCEGVAFERAAAFILDSGNCCSGRAATF
jgi:hypothetical protein